MITWWQVLIVFFVYGTGARLDEKLSQDSDFRHGAGLLLRIISVAAFTVGAWLLLNTWAGISW